MFNLLLAVVSLLNRRMAETHCSEDVAPPVECQNGVCVLNWKPTRPAA